MSLVGILLHNIKRGLAWISALDYDEDGSMITCSLGMQGQSYL